MAEDLKGLDDWAEEAGAKVEEAAASGVLLAAEHAAGEIRNRVLRVFTGAPTGNLARSFTATFVGNTEGGIGAMAASDLIYAGIQDRGGVIKPKSVKRLAIPQVRLPIGKWPRHFAKGELVRRGGALYEAGEGGRKMFVLARQVRITGRNYIEDTLKDIEEELGEITGDAVFAEAIKPGTEGE